MLFMSVRTSRAAGYHHRPRPGSFQVLLSRLASFHEIRGAPTERGTSCLHHEQIRNQAGVPPIAVRERMNQYQPMMESNRYFVDRIRGVLDPVASIAEWRFDSDLLIIPALEPAMLSGRTRGLRPSFQGTLLAN
jgi:hypothetical protein